MARNAPPGLVGTAYVAARVGAAERTVRKWAQQGLIPSIRIGTTLRFDPQEVEQLIDAGRTSRARS